MADAPAMTEVQFTDIHCHLVPAIDDGAKSWEETLEMARMAVREGFVATVCTPHQLGAFRHNSGDEIRRRVVQLQQVLDDHQIPLKVLPGADVRIELDMVELLERGEVLTLADRRRHVLLELPHELYFPLDEVLRQLKQRQMAGILSHPERNQGLLRDWGAIEQLVAQQCLMQVTAGSLLGAFGTQCTGMCEWMLREGLVHFLATDAHGPKSRRPLMQRAFQRVCELSGEEIARRICCDNPAAVAEGGEVDTRCRPKTSKASASWLPWRRKAA